MQTQTLTNESTQSGVLNLPAALLRLEGLLVLAAAVALYAQQDFSWVTFAVLFLTPDLAILPYAINKRLGAVVYDILHTYALPIALGTCGLLLDTPTATQIALIWLAHIGMDRTVGYGLKYLDGDFKATHLSRI